MHQNFKLLLCKQTSNNERLFWLWHFAWCRFTYIALVRKLRMTTGAETKKKNIIDVIPALVVTQRSTQVHQGHEQNKSSCWKFVEFKVALHDPLDIRRPSIIQVHRRVILQLLAWSRSGRVLRSCSLRKRGQCWQILYKNLTTYLLT